ncbi:hypothetical protein RUND412_001884 [Rhizina undulata]
MRYSYGTIALAALAATTMAAPPHRKRQEGVLTVTTTVCYTETVTDTPTAAVNVQEYTGAAQVYSTADSWGWGWWSQESSAVTYETTAVITSVPATSAVEQVAAAVTSTYVAPEATSTYVAPAVTSAAETVVATTTTAAAAAVSSASTSSSDDLASKVLASHNAYRALHGAPNLTYNTTMADFAAAHVAKCVFEHSGGPYGENLAAGYDTPEAAITAWYDENTLYDYSTGLFSEATGHFTQVVWKDATQVGCGIYNCDGTDNTPGEYLSCNYDTGNVIGEFIANVLPLGTAVSK